MDQRITEQVITLYRTIKLDIFKTKKGPLNEEDRLRAMHQAMNQIFEPEELKQISDKLKK